MWQSRTACQRLLAAAEQYVARGWRVVPLYSVTAEGRCTCGNAECSSPGKHPCVAHGVHASTHSAAVVRVWWGEEHPGANIGIHTGHASGIVVFDIDPRHGGTLEALGDIPITKQVLTGGDGRHVYFCYPADGAALEIRCSSGQFAPGVDVRGEGGYVVAPPSLHASGAHYRGAAPRVHLAPLPVALIKRCATPESIARWSVQHTPGPHVPLVDVVHPADRNVCPTDPTVAADTKGPAEKAGARPMTLPPLEHALGPEDQRIPQGQRHTMLVHFAGLLRFHGFTTAEIGGALHMVNIMRCEPPLPDDEVRGIAKSMALYAPHEAATLHPAPAPVALRDLLAHGEADVHWVARGLLPEGLTLLAGKPKVGKSWRALGMALAVARGEPALGMAETTAGEVLVLALEETDRRIRRRMTVLLHGQPAPEGFFCQTTWPRVGEGCETALAAWLAQHPQCRLVIVDTLAKVKPDPSHAQSVYDADYAAISPLKAVAEAHHVALVVVHHLRKQTAEDPMDLISGTTGLTGAADGVLIVQRPRGELTATLHVTGRDVEEQALALAFTPATGAWASLGPAPRDQPPQPPRSQVRDDILAALRAADHPLTCEEIATVLGKSENYTGVYLHHRTPLLHEERPRSRGDSTEGVGRTLLYVL